jgi:hypothetical protein
MGWDLDMAAGKASPRRIFSASLADMRSSTSGSYSAKHKHQLSLWLNHQLRTIFSRVPSSTQHGKICMPGQALGTWHAFQTASPSLQTNLHCNGRMVSPGALPGRPPECRPLRGRCESLSAAGPAGRRWAACLLATSCTIRHYFF